MMSWPLRRLFVIMVVLGLPATALLGWTFAPHWIPAWSGTFGLAATEIPQTLNHQGVVCVNGVRFSGAGQFRFALVDGNGTVVWNHVGTQPASPASSVSLTVSDGVYNVTLGAAPLSPIPVSALEQAGLKVRVWFDDGVHGLQQMSPDQNLSACPYAFVAATVVDGAIDSAKLADSAVTAAKLAADVAVVPVGSVIATARSTAPDGWLLCDGSAVSRTGYAALFAAIGTSYGSGDNSTTFNLPDLRGRFALGKVGSATGFGRVIDDVLGHTGGNREHYHGKGTLNITSSGSHNHSAGPFSSTVSGPEWVGAPGMAQGRYENTSSVSHTHPSSSFSGSVGSTTNGANAEQANIGAAPPYQVLNYVIKY